MYPALAVTQALGAEANPVLWVGGQGGLEASLVQRAGIPFKAIPAAGIHGVGLKNLPRNLWSLWRGMLAARRIVKDFRPDVLLFTGGYVGVPMAFAARSLPTLVYVPDIEPGLALKLLARFADRIAITAEATRPFLPSGKRVVVTGYPVRPELKQWDPQQARARFGIAPTEKVLLVFGGSKGAHSINQAVLAHLPRLLSLCHVVHISGELDWALVQAAAAGLPAGQANRYHTFPYLHEEMGAALAAADLVVSRAGASTLGEFPLFGLPAILVPYPYAWRYQRVNAEHLCANGAAVMLVDADLNEKLADVVSGVMENPSQMSAMRTAMHSLATPDPALQLAGLLRELAESGGQPW